LLNVKDAAVYLGRSEQAVQHLIFEKALPVVRIGRRVHLDRREWVFEYVVEELSAGGMATGPGVSSLRAFLPRI
jgi:excisionase family DNA binding protein